MAHGTAPHASAGGRALGLVLLGVVGCMPAPSYAPAPAVAPPAPQPAAPATVAEPPATVTEQLVQAPPPPGGARALELAGPGHSTVQPAAAATPELRRALALYARRIAVTIGVDDYRAPLARLSAAVSDAERTAELFRLMGFDEVLSIADAQATRTGILELLEQRVAVRAGPNDLVVVFFAGHGTTVGGRGFIMPQDGTGEPTKSGISVQELKETALRMKAKHVLFLMDACFSGSMFTRAATTENTNALAYWESAAGKRVVQIITAGGADETVLETDGWGAFTRALHEGLAGPADLNGDLVVTVDELAGHVTTQVEGATRAQQHPQWGNVEGRGTILLWDARRVPTEARVERIPRELIKGLEDDLRQIHELMDQKDFRPAERAVRDLGVHQSNPELNLLLAEIYAGQDALGNASLVEAELKRVEGQPGLTENQRRRIVATRTAVERARRDRY